MDTPNIPNNQVKPTPIAGDILSPPNTLAMFGWTSELAKKWELVASDGLQPARVIADFGTSLKIATPGVYKAELSGKMAHYANRQNVPKVGDWVAAKLFSDGRAVIEAVMPRRSEIARKVAGDRTVKQVIAANIDIAFVLLALNNDFSIKRLERFLYQLSINNISPVIVLNKADKLGLASETQHYTSQLNRFKLPIVIAAAAKGLGVPKIAKYIKPGKTAILLGSSGVGKSTLTNQLLGRHIQATGEVRSSDSAGKHTTVHRELFILPGGGLLVDTPGIRELQLWGTQKDLHENFEDITLLFSQCKYSTCRHGSEQGCAIKKALNSKQLNQQHYKNYLKMKLELAELKQRIATPAKRQNKKSTKNLHRQNQDILSELND